jgi:pyruvate-formate lyase-activating enzyme
VKVLLATSPHVRHAAVLQSDFTPDPTSMYTFAPVGLLSLAATLREERPEVSCELYDLNRRIISGALPLDERFYASVAQDLCARAPDVIGFMTECDSYHHLLQIAGEVKRIAPGTAIVLGGPHASAVARATLERCEDVDAVVIGEGEATFPKVLDALASPSTHGVPGGLIRSARDPGELLDGGARALVGKLDDLPIPAYDLYVPDPGEEIFIEVGRGCPFQCTFCSTAPYWNRRHRVKSPERILAEIALVRELFGTTRAHFTHDLFTTHRRWVRTVCAALIDAGVPIRWTCSARTDTVEEDLLDLMARAGCDAIYFGIESGSERVLREIRKDIPLARSFAVLEQCGRVGITPNAGFIVGFPSEDSESIRETFLAHERALRLGCRPTHLFAFCPFADSELYADCGELRCTGHFVDLPLGTATDLANRRLVASDSDLYGAYFRPRLGEVVPGRPDAIFAMDEFSPLAEAALIPTLALAELCGGMYEVFRRWVSWIETRNDARGAPGYRRGYGSPADFATFVLGELNASGQATEPVLAAAQAVRLNLLVVQRELPRASTTMASHRSLVLPATDDARSITLDTRIARGDIAASLALDYDVTPALAGRLDGELPREPTYLVWQATDGDTVRLLRVNRFIFETLETLGLRSVAAGDLILERFTGAGEEPAEGAGRIDAGELLESLAEAARQGLVTA